MHVDYTKHGAKPFSIHGRLGGAFNVEGEGFGTEGTLMVGGRVLETTSWSDTLIKGQFPAELGPGPVSVNGKVVGQYPNPPKPVVAPPAAVIGPSGVEAAKK